MDVNLEKEMKSDTEIIALCANRETAEDFYRALCNMRWKKKSILPEVDQIVEILKGEEPGVWHCSWRYAGGIIAEIRNENHGTSEDYLDFYCSGNEGMVADFVERCFNRLGWEQYPYEDDGL